MYIKFPGGKSKVLTLSYDDEPIEDIRLISILNKHGIKATFNINTGLYCPEDFTRVNGRGAMKLSEAQALYTNSGHEVAVHAFTHLFLDRISTDEVITEIMQDRMNIEAQYNTLARGMAYPYGTYNDEVIDILKKCGICYARTAKETENFWFPKNWLALETTCHHNNPKLMELAKRFVEQKSRHIGENWLFYVFGHSFEFENDHNWDRIENFAAYVGGREDIWYATNIEIYDYMMAFQNLQTSVDKKIVHNPSVMDVWFHHQGELHCVKGGQTLYL